THEAQGRLRVSFLDVGQGDAALVELPGGAAIAVDGGGLSGGDVLVSAMRARGLAHLSGIALSHPQLDHYGGFAALLASFPVDSFWSPGATSPTASFARLAAAVERAHAERRVARAGDVLIGSAGARIDALYPGREAHGRSVNDASLVLALR